MSQEQRNPLEPGKQTPDRETDRQKNKPDRQETE